MTHEVNGARCLNCGEQVDAETFDHATEYVVHDGNGRTRRFIDSRRVIDRNYILSVSLGILGTAILALVSATAVIVRKIDARDLMMLANATDPWRGAHVIEGERERQRRDPEYSRYALDGDDVTKIQERVAARERRYGDAQQWRQ